jgi:hypothetical protein
VVTFLRSSPAGPLSAGSSVGQASARALARVQGTWPITQVFDSRDAVDVRLIDEEPRERTGQRIQLRRIDGAWTIERVSWWVLD